MLSFYDRASLRRALTLSLRADLTELLHKRIRQIFDDGLVDLTHLLVIEADDTEAMVREEIGFSPLEVEGVRYGAPGFLPIWDILHHHPGWFEMVFCIGDSGFAVVLLIEDAQNSSFPDLQAACRAGSLKPGKLPVRATKNGAAWRPPQLRHLSRQLRAGGEAPELVTIPEIVIG